MNNFLTKIWNWIAIDGLLHFETCFLIAVLIGTIFNIWSGILVSIAAGILKEVYDKLKKDCTWPMMYHDLICDGVGILLAILVMIL